MPGVTEEQITAAKQMSAIEFLRRYRPGQLVKAESRGEFQLKEHDSFKINETTSLWHWKSRDVGGKSALDYLIKVEGLKFVEAVQTLCGENPSYVPPVSQPEQPKEFLLPPAAENNRRVFAYLLKRASGQESSTKAPTTTTLCLLGRTKPVLPGMLFCVVPIHGETHSRQRCPAAISGFVFVSRRKGKAKNSPYMKPQ